jgi:hypothetical protein
MTWAGAYAEWRRLDGAIWFGVAVYLYLSRRRLRQRLAHAEGEVRIQVAVIRSLIRAASLCGITLHLPEHEHDDEPDSNSKEGLH